MSNPVILCIDSSVSNASVALAKGKTVLETKICTEQKQHAAFLQPAIKELLQENKIKNQDLSAIAVTNGPGSYTGLRISMATAKGLCYALQIPLITIGTLDVMAATAKEQLQSSFFLCPLIDARRMEVFTAMYNEALQMILPPQALILNETSFAELLAQRKIIFFGTGAKKWAEICNHPNALFETINWNASSLISLATEYFQNQHFSSLAYATPFYAKEFHFGNTK